MAFPNVPRVRYENNPLEEVTCQLRFPSILRITAESPVGFQDAIRNNFPLFSESSSVQLPAGIPANISRVVRRDLGALGKKSYVFESADRRWKIKLAQDSLSLISRKYDGWEDFRARLEAPFQTLLQEYCPALFTHTCLKYRNVIRRSRLSSPLLAWQSLLQPWMIGPLSSSSTLNQTEAFEARTLIVLPEDSGKLDAKFGLALQQPLPDHVFLIDAHLFHEEQKGETDVFPRIDSLNRQARLFFRWCITDELHRELCPVAIEPG